MPPPNYFLLRRVLEAAAACALIMGIGVLPSAQSPAGQNPPPAGGRGAPPVPQGRGQGSPASQRPPESVTPQSYSPDQVKTGAPIFAAQCGFCHGRDAAGGETGPDLTRSLVVAEDVRGDKIGPIVRSGRPDKGMPPFNISDPDLAVIVAFIHDAKAKADANVGDRRTVDIGDLQTGDAEAGVRYFNGAGGCAACHSPTGDLAGVAARLHGLPLLQRMLYPGGRGRSNASARPPTVTVTLPSGATVKGKLAYRDEFAIALVDAAGWHRSWPAAQVKFTVDDPLEAHAAQLGKYTDKDMHDVLAYLQTLR